MSVATDEPRVEQPSAPRGSAFYVGIALLVAGVGLLGYVGWQFLGTNFVSRQAQERIVEDLLERWRTEDPVTLEGRAGGATGPAAEPVALGEATALVRIPAFGEQYVVPVLEGVSDDVLAQGYGHFPGAAGPGEKGNYALAAHRVTHGEPLRDMPELRPGDRVIVETRDAVYTYRLDTNPNDLVVTFTDVWVVDPLPDNPVPRGVEPAQRPGQRLITLTTCSELFHTDNRMIAFGHLVDTEKKPR